MADKLLDLTLKINTGKFFDVEVKLQSQDYEKKLQKAQFWLDNAVLTSMLPFVPIESGNLQQMIVAESASVAGSGKVCAYTTPYGRYQYYGVKMVDSVTGKGPRRIPLEDGSIIFRYKLGATLIPTDIPLQYTSPTATAKWFETAKENYYKDWVKGVERILNGK